MLRTSSLLRIIEYIFCFNMKYSPAKTRSLWIFLVLGFVAIFWSASIHFLDAIFWSASTSVSFARQSKLVHHGSTRSSGNVNTALRPQGPSAAQLTMMKSSPGMFRNTSGLFAIVTGMEHSGTTILSQFIKSSPSLFGGFEGGFLLAKDPQSFVKIQPFYNWTLIPEGWGLSEAERSELCRARSHAEMFTFLIRNSPVMAKDSYIVDKTPRYVYSLDEVMLRAPDVPVVVTMKRKEMIRSSWKSHGRSDEFFEIMYRKSSESIARALSLFPSRIHFVSMDSLEKNPHTVLGDVFSFLGLEWLDSYISMDAFHEKWRRLGHSNIWPTPVHKGGILVGR